MHVRCLFSAFAALLSQIAGCNDRRSFVLLRFLDAIALFRVARLEYRQRDSAFAVHTRMLMSSQLALSYRSLLSGCGATGGPAQQLGTAVLVSSMSGGPDAYILQQLILTIASLRVLIFGEYFVAIYVMTAGYIWLLLNWWCVQVVTITVPNEGRLWGLFGLVELREQGMFVSELIRLLLLL